MHSIFITQFKVNVFIVQNVKLKLLENPNQAFAMFMHGAVRIITDAERDEFVYVSRTFTWLQEYCGNV